jgi:hypothetical protein
LSDHRNIGNAEKVAAEFGRGFYSKIIQQYQDVTDAGLRDSEHTQATKAYIFR